jgi:hypothetical protein
MGEKNKTDRYVNRINSEILPNIDYGLLQKSYDADLDYAKGVLNRLYKAMVEVYGSERLCENDGDEGFVVVPGVIRGRNSGKLCLALLDLDLSSSGEHWGTALLSQYGIVKQRDFGSGSAGEQQYFKDFLPYDYCYTADIPDDIHFRADNLPRELKAVLKDFREHNAILRGEHITRKDKSVREPAGKQSVLSQIRGAEQQPREQKGRKAPRNKTEPER